MEFIGTFFFVFTIAMTGNTFAIAAMLSAWIYVGANVSGGHYNPMVSLSITLRGLLSWENFVKYSVAQTFGSFCAFTLESYLKASGIKIEPNANITLINAFILELLLAFVLAFVILTVATSPKYKHNQIFGIAIGLAFAALLFIGSPMSGGVFNPAIALGNFLAGFLKNIRVPYEILAMYLASGFTGGAMAAFFYKYFFAQEEQ